MIRCHCAFATVAIGMFAVLGSTGHRSPGPAWDPAESRAGLFGSRESPRALPSFPSTSGTLARWGEARQADPGQAAPAPTRLARGVLISLVSMSTTFSAIVEPPSTGRASNMLCAGPAPYVSVSDGYDGSTCSTDASGTSCSAQWTGAGSAGGACSINDATTFCSTAPSAATSFCSTQGPSTSKITCSVLASSGGDSSCSTQGDANNSCSVQGAPKNGGSSQTCSTGTAALPVDGGPSSGTCSSTAAAPKAGSTGVCSVSGGGAANTGLQQNQCSTGFGGGETCSALNANSFCSVAANVTNAYCTAGVGGGGAPANGNFCSAVGNVPAAQCSVMPVANAPAAVATCKPTPPPQPTGPITAAAD